NQAEEYCEVRVRQSVDLKSVEVPWHKRDGGREVKPYNLPENTGKHSDGETRPDDTTRYAAPVDTNVEIGRYVWREAATRPIQKEFDNIERREGGGELLTTHPAEPEVDELVKSSLGLVDDKLCLRLRQIARQQEQGSEACACQCAQDSHGALPSMRSCSDTCPLAVPETCSYSMFV